MNRTVRRSRIWLSGVALIALAAIGVWEARRPIASGLVARELARRGVAARYTITQIGFRTQRIEQLSLGDPAHPDLTADWAEVSLKPVWGGVALTEVRASGVRLRGRLIGDRVSWGAVDKLLPPSSGKPFALPQFFARLSDARVDLATRYGAVVALVDGQGRLDNGFRGRALVAAARLGQADCAASGVGASLDLAIDRERLHLKGPVRGDAFTCGAAGVDDSLATVDAQLNAAFGLEKAAASVAARGVRAAGLAMPTLAGQLEARRRGARLVGSFALSGPNARYAATRLLGARLAGRFAQERAIHVDGELTVARAVPDTASFTGLVRSLRAAKTSPVGPLAERLAGALNTASAGVALSAAGSWHRADSLATWRLGKVELAGRDGLVARVTPGDAPSRPTTLALSGGGFPTASGVIAQSGSGHWRGLISVEPYSAGAARLRLAPVRFVASTGGVGRIESEALFDGSLGDGRVEGLSFPVVAQRMADGRLVVQPGCAPVAWRYLGASGVRIGPTQVKLCPIDGRALLSVVGGRVSGGARSGPLRLQGSSGSAPLSAEARSLSVDVKGSLRLDAVAVRLGAATRLDIARLDGSLSGGGQFAGLAGQIGGVPLIIDRGTGRWRFARGTLALDGALRVADADAEPRFTALTTDDARLTLADGKIAASATLVEPASRTTVTRVAIAHDLSSGIGDARLAVDALTFGKQFQPEALTRLTLGVVANVQGRIDGGGTIRWSKDGVTSDGRFTTANLDLAAAFGPISGIAGTIMFDDLLALRTPPGQRVTIRAINAGVTVERGAVGFHLLPGQRVVVENGRWPFAGGTLSLEPATLDFGQPTTRRLAFRVSGLDAAQFIEQLKLQDIAATGTFDGVLPILFDATGARVAGGRIVSGPGGGRLAYVGDVSNAQTNMFAKLAFDALKSMRYSNLTIELDGALDGEVVSRVNFAGVNQSPVAPTGLARSFTGLPFKFNILIRAPFRGLVNSARGLQDPSLLLGAPVQPPASAPRAKP